MTYFKQTNLWLRVTMLLICLAFTLHLYAMDTPGWAQLNQMCALSNGANQMNGVVNTTGVRNGTLTDVGGGYVQRNYTWYYTNGTNITTLVNESTAVNVLVRTLTPSTCGQFQFCRDLSRYDGNGCGSGLITAVQALEIIGFICILTAVFLVLAVVHVEELRGNKCVLIWIFVFTLIAATAIISGIIIFEGAICSTPYASALGILAGMCALVAAIFCLTAICMDGCCTNLCGRAGCCGDWDGCFGLCGDMYLGRCGENFCGVEANSHHKSSGKVNASHSNDGKRGCCFPVRVNARDDFPPRAKARVGGHVSHPTVSVEDPDVRVNAKAPTGNVNIHHEAPKVVYSNDRYDAHGNLHHESPKIIYSGDRYDRRGNVHYEGPTYGSYPGDRYDGQNVTLRGPEPSGSIRTTGPTVKLPQPTVTVTRPPEPAVTVRHREGSFVIDDGGARANTSLNLKTPGVSGGSRVGSAGVKGGSVGVSGGSDGVKVGSGGASGGSGGARIGSAGVKVGTGGVSGSSGGVSGGVSGGSGGVKKSEGGASVTVPSIKLPSASFNVE